MTRPTPRGARGATFELAGETLLVLSHAVEPPPLPDALTAGERAIVASILAGMSNAAIAERRGTSARTVANQIASIFRKLGVRSRAELAARLARSEK